MENKKESIAQRLRKAREMAGSTQSPIAKILGLHRPSISEIEAGRRSVTTDELLIFSETYSVDFNWILKGNRDSESKRDNKIEIAARELEKLKDEDINKVMDLLFSLKQDGEHK